MRRLALSVFATVCCICAYSAQYYRISSVGNGNPNTKLKYVGQTDSTTQILATFTLPDNATEALLLNVSRKTYVTDGDVSYKLVRTGNIPIADESMIEYSILEKGSTQLNFILEFEQFPLDGPFDIMDDVSDGNSLEFTDIKVDTQSMREVDQNRFVKSTPVTRCGSYYDEGDYYKYYVRDGVFVSCHTAYGDDYFALYMDIQNHSDHGILFNTNKITATGEKESKKGSETVNLALISKNDYVSRVAASDRYQAEKASQSQGLYEISSAVSFASIGVPYRSLEHTGLNVLGGFIQDAQNSMAKPYLAELDKTRAERTSNYLLSQSLKPGESISGFFRITRPKKVNHFSVTVNMDSYGFVFTGYIQ